MPRQIKPTRQPGRGRPPSQHPFEQWFKLLQKSKTRCIALYPEDDFDCTINAMRQALWNWGRSQGIQISVHVYEDHLEVHLLDQPDNKASRLR